MDVAKVRSKRGKQQFGITARPTGLLSQITPRQAEALGLKETGMAYYVRPDGATLREVIILQPNGAPTKHDNGVEARERMRAKGYEYIGPVLTKEGVQRAVEVIKQNRDDYIMFLNEVIEDAEDVIANADEPTKRSGYRRRKAQAEALLEEAERPMDIDGMVAELEEIAKAQRLAVLPAEMREAMSELLGDQMRALIEKVSQSAVTPEVKQARMRSAKKDFIDREDE